MTDIPTGSDGSPDGAIRPLATLPLFFKLGGRRVVLAGSGDGAAWKAELLAAAGPHVDVYAEAAGEKLRDAASRLPNLNLFARAWNASDLPGAALAILDTSDDEEARAFVAAARAAGAPVNVVDRPAFCDFSFATIVNRSPLIVAISTDGASPVLAQAIRARLEALLPRALADWMRAAREWRRRIGALGWEFGQRRAFWEAFAARAMAHAERQPDSEDFEALAAAQARGARAVKGKIYLVGAGPGDPELLTMKAMRVLQGAEVIMYDSLVSAGVLELARREALRVPVGKRAGAPSMKQVEITAQLIAFAREGKTVVRLKGGDPMVFGRANEEIEAARAAGVDCEVVPGITVALAAAASLGASLSDKTRARRIQFVTAHDSDGALTEGLDWRSLADPDATTAVYMGVRVLPALTAKLIEAGLDASTPAALMENVGRDNERRLRAPLGSLAREAGAWSSGGPAVLLYGAALAEPET